MSRHSAARASRLIGLGTLCVSMAAGRVSAQAWSAQLVLAPMPSPYLSDWEIDPTIGQLIVTNPGAAATDVTFHYTVTRNGKMLLRGATDPVTIPGLQSVVFTGASTFGGRADWDRDVQQTIARTGKLPEGEYEGCVTLIGPGRIVLVERQCARFNTQSSDPPFLVSPANGDTLTSLDPIFEWQPVQVPPAAAVRVGYVLQIAEVRTAAGQRPEVALESNILHYVEPNLVQTSHQYPVGALPLVSGRTYAWRVQALDGDGKPAATNQGRSEIWTFVYRETETEVTRTVARVELNPRSDTLRFPGDTSRYEVTAYDADNVEILGKTIRWSAVDTTIARADSTGVVTGAGTGRTQIVASVDGVADSALTVTAARVLAVRFELYNAGSDAPSLLELIKSGSFEEVVPQLMAQLQAGELVIPIPRRPGGAGAGGGGGGDNHQSGAESRSRGGPSATAATHGIHVASEAPADCPVESAVTVDLDTTKKAFVLRFPGVTDIGSCVELPSKDSDEAETVADTTFHRSTVFVISWQHPGLPRAFLAVKGMGQLPLPLGGTQVRVRYFVVNFVRSMTVGSDVMPDRFAGFFGTESFDAGVGFTLYAKRSCTRSAEPVVPRMEGPEESGGLRRFPDGMLCSVLRAINPTDPDITIQSFLGVTASETSVGLQGEGRGPSRAPVGVSMALGFSINATLPVRKFVRESGTFGLDSAQLGLLFAVQDSLVAAEGESAVKGNWSVGISPTLTMWLTGTKDREWQVSGSIGVEWDPKAILGGGDYAWAPKLVVSGLLEQTWSLGVVRLGGPQFVFTTPLGQLVGQHEATTLAISGSWGFGTPAGVGLVDDDGGGAPTDAGSARPGGASGFAELGRGQVTLSWKTPPTAQERQQQLALARESRDSATAAVTRQLHKVRDANARLEQARKGRESAVGKPQAEFHVADSLFKAADAAHIRENVELERLRKARGDARNALVTPPTECKKLFGRCVTWEARLSAGNGAMNDLLPALVRLISGTL